MAYQIHTKCKSHVNSYLICIGDGVVAPGTVFGVTYVLIYKLSVLNFNQYNNNKAFNPKYF
jgi:hypothetical protein